MTQKEQQLENEFELGDLSDTMLIWSCQVYPKSIFFSVLYWILSKEISSVAENNLNWYYKFMQFCYYNDLVW